MIDNEYVKGVSVFKNVDIYDSGAGNGRGTDQLTFFNRGQIIPQYYYKPPDFGRSNYSAPAFLCVNRIFLDTYVGVW